MGMIKEGEHGQRLHPTQKPIKLLASIISDYTKEGNIVLDPYLGSGSTLIACEQTERICFGAEIDPHYCDVIVKRWEEFTGQKANLLTKHQD
jgi:DNA modification methylase